MLRISCGETSLMSSCSWCANFVAAVEGCLEVGEHFPEAVPLPQQWFLVRILQVLPLCYVRYLII